MSRDRWDSKDLSDGVHECPERFGTPFGTPHGQLPAVSGDRHTLEPRGADTLRATRARPVRMVTDENDCVPRVSGMA